MSLGTLAKAPPPAYNPTISHAGFKRRLGLSLALAPVTGPFHRSSRPRRQNRKKEKQAHGTAQCYYAPAA
jgi:hypothetical protein